MRQMLRRIALVLAAGTMGAVAIAAATLFATASPAGAATASTTSAAAATTLTWPQVSIGAQGERVVAIQYLLNERIGAGLVVDGIFGPKTEAAVKDFQRKAKIGVDGIVGPVTWTHLIITVTKGDTGPAVSAVQHNLRFAYGFKTLAVDGIFGPLTDAAVRDFQAKFKIGVDGIVGPITWNTLIVHEK